MNTFLSLLDTLIAAPDERRAGIERVIRDTFERHKAVLALDMSGFTLSVRREGVLPYLCQVRRMQRLTVPIVSSFRGEMVKFSADNLLAIFESVESALNAAIEMMRVAANENPTIGPKLVFSIGIDCGELLFIEHVDCFGDPVNLAYKLGEDVAGPGEILLTERAKKQLCEPHGFQLHEMPVSISGVPITAYSASSK